MTITENATTDRSGGRGNDGRVVGIAGPVIDVEFGRGDLPRAELGDRVRDRDRGQGAHGAGRGRPAARRGPHPRRVHAANRRAPARHPSAQHREGHHRAGRGAGARPRVERLGRSARLRRRRVRRHGALGDPPRRAGLRRPRAVGPDVRDRHQGHRPADAVRGRRQDRPVRWGGRGQDRAHHRDDQPGRLTARWRVGVRRGR